MIDAVYRWLLACCRTPDSWTTYGAAIQDWIGWSLKRSLHRQVDTVPRELGDYLRQLESEQLAPRTIALRRDVLRSWFAWLVELGLMNRTPINREIRRSWRIDHEALVIHGGSRQALTLAQGKRLATWALRDAPSEAGFAVLLQAAGGLRSAEVANAQLVDWMEGEGGIVSLLVHGKGRKVRTIVLEPVVVDAGRRYFAEHRRSGKRGPLIARPGGGHYTARRIQQWAEQAARALGRQGEISSHCLRATASTLLMEDGAHLEQVSKQLGHASIVHTARCYVVRRRPLAARTGITVESTP